MKNLKLKYFYWDGNSLVGVVLGDQVDKTYYYVGLFYEVDFKCDTGRNLKCRI